MNSNHVMVYCGDGRGKTDAAIGRSLKYASQGKDVIIGQFLKGRNMDDLSILKELEPQIRVFRFETKEEQYADLSRDEQEQEESNIRNGINYVKKVLQTGECDLCVVDEILGLVDNHIIELQDIIRLIEAKDENMELILTGRNMPIGLTSYVSDVCEICAKKVTKE